MINMLKKADYYDKATKEIAPIHNSPSDSCSSDEFNNNIKRTYIVLYYNIIILNAFKTL